MAPRIVMVAHAATSATRRSAFPLDEEIDADQVTTPVPVRAGVYLAGPELRCRQTASALGWDVEVVDGFADLNAGRWSGLELGELFAAEPDSMMSWLHDAEARPHDGESLVDVVTRVGVALDGRPWPDGRSVVVTSPLVIRAALVHLLKAPPSLLFAVHIAPLSATVVTGHAGRWKLRGLLPWGTWKVGEGERSPL
jgi:broad specificity phosphatase PhoE